MIQILPGIVRYSECDENGRLSLPSLINYFQDAAEYHGYNLGIGYRYLSARHLGWLVSGWQIVIDRLPEIGEKYTIQTWGWKFIGIFGMRNCTLLDEAGSTIVRANSTWFLYDLEKGLPIRVPEDMIDKYGVHPRAEMKYASRKVADPEDGESFESFTVVRQNLDTNHHVNNAQYVAMAQAVLPEGEHYHELRIEYKKQARLGDIITPLVQKREDGYGVSLRAADGEPYISAEFIR